MGDAKYNFERVLVANASLLLPIGGQEDNEPPASQPDVLVLNNKLNKCQKASAESWQCQSCCLQIEMAEFRRRTSFNALASRGDNAECLANCSDKRNVSIELRAKAQLSGKLVVLAVTEVAGDFEGGSSLSCRLQSSWPFYKFNPRLPAGELHLNRTKQTYYAKLSSRQLPTLSIPLMSIHRNSSAGREAISLGLESQRTRKEQQVVLKETLIVNEYLCSAVFAPNLTSLSLLEGPTRRLHLLALLNRDRPAPGQPLNRTGSTGSELSSQVGSPRESLVGSTSVTEESKPTVTSSTSLEGILSASHQEEDAELERSMQQNRRAVSSLLVSTSTSQPTSRVTFKASGGNLHEHINSKAVLTATTESSISQRMDSTPTLTTKPHETSPPSSLFNGTVARPLATLELSPGAVNSIKLGPSNLIDLESVRMRLKSNSLLMFTVSSCFVILTYTLCLLIYLRARNRRSNSNAPSSASSTKRILASKPTNNDHKPTANLNNAKTIEISEPYNLQMAPATKTRLDMMMGLNRKKRKHEKHTSYSNSYAARPHYPQEVIDEFCNYNDASFYSHGFQQDCMFLRRGHSNNQLYEDVPEFNELAYPSQHNRHKHPYLLPSDAFDTHHTYAPISVVQAIKEAATLAKMRFKTSSFKPNLNVIPESDLEYLQNSPKEELQLLANLLNGGLSSELMSSEQFDSLVEEAMSNECSHKNNETIYEQGATLFSKPQPIYNSLSSERPISRSRILQQVKMPGEEEEEYEYSKRKNSQ